MMVRFVRVSVPSDGTWIVSQSKRNSNIEVPFDRFTPSLSRMKKNFLRRWGFTARVSVSLMGDLVALIVEPLYRRDWRNALLLKGGVHIYNTISLVFMPFHISLCDRNSMTDDEFNTLKELFGDTVMQIPIADVNGEGTLILDTTFLHFVVLDDMYRRKYWWKHCGLHISG